MWYPFQIQIDVSEVMLLIQLDDVALISTLISS